MPAPEGNKNALKNGTRVGARNGRIAGLTIGEVPTKLLSIQREARKYRRALEEAVLETHGQITVMSAHSIDTASSNVFHAGICRWVLRNKLPTMTQQDVIACSREITKAKEARDRAVKALNLDRIQKDVLDELYPKLKQE